MNKYFTSLALITLLATSMAHAAGTSDAKNGYVKLEGGVSFKNQISKGFGNITGATVSKKTKNGTGAFAVGAGLYVSDYFRTDIAYNHFMDIKRNTNIDNSYIIANYKIKHENVMLTAYYDIRTDSSVTPFILAGIGYGRNKTKPTNFYYPDSNNSSIVSAKTRTNFVYSLGVGASVALNPKVDLDLTYRFTDLGKAHTGSSMRSNNVVEAFDPQKGHLRSHTAMLGLRYSFY